MSERVTRYASNAPASSSLSDGTSPDIARAPSGARRSRAHSHSLGKGNSDMVQPRYRRYPPRAGSATTFNHAETNELLRSAASPCASASVSQLTA